MDAPPDDEGEEGCDAPAPGDAEALEGCVRPEPAGAPIIPTTTAAAASTATDPAATAL